MNRNTITLFGIAALLASPVWGRILNAPLYHLNSASIDLSPSSSPVFPKGEDPQPQPVYNLYQLSKLISSKQDNISAAGYINNLLDNSKLNDEEKDKLRVNLFKYISINDNKIKFEEQLKEYLVNRLNNMEDKSFTEKIVKSIPVKNYKKSNLVDKINNIHNLNLILSKYKSFNLIESLNNEIPLIYTLLNDIKTDRTESINIINTANIDSISPQIIPENDLLIIDINKVLELSGNFKISSLDDSTLNKLDIYYKTLTNIKNRLSYDNENQNILSNSIIKLEKILTAEEYINLIKNTISENKSLLKDIEKIQFKDLNEDNFTLNIKLSLAHYKQVRDVRNKLFSEVVNEYINNLKSNNEEVKIIKNEKANLDISAPLKSLPISERIEDKVISDNRLKLPSESDIINGVALFMANRAKQETMIWFIDKLKKDLNNSLIKSSFPLTYSKLIEHDDLRVPQFNSSWQMAISEDFVKMPQNIINSQWLSEKATIANKSKELENIKLTYGYSQRFISLLNGKNDLRNVFEDLYTQKVIYSDTNSRTSLFRSIEFLYILMNEFYNVDSNHKLNTLTFADFEKIDDVQWSVFLDLVKLKYGKGAYEDLNYIIYKLKSNQNIDNVNRQFAHITNAFESIELLAKSSDFNTKEEKATELIEKTVDLLKYFDPDFNTVNNNFNSGKYRQIQQFEDLLKIYKSINKKEFGKSAKSIISFIQPFVNDNLGLVFVDGKLSVDSNLNDTNILSLFKGIDNFKSSDENKSKNRIAINLSGKLPFKEDTKFKISSDAGKLNFIFNEEENFSVDLKELSVGFSELKDVKFNKENYIKFLNQSQDLRLLVERFIKESNAKVDEDQIYKYVEFIGFIAEASNSPLETLKSFVDKSSITQLKEINKNNLNGSGQLLVKTTTFFSDILHARDEQGVYRAINNAVAPPTSYMTKRKYPHTFTLNGYVGGYFGYQASTSNPADYKSGMSYGITAPIGITYSTQNWGLFIYPIDLGNLVGHYIWETNKEYEKQKVSVKEVFSPGISFLYNIPDSPFVLFTGAKFVQVPERYVEERGYLNSTTFDLVQFNAGIKIDIPFITIKAWKPKYNLMPKYN